MPEGRKNGFLPAYAKVRKHVYNLAASEIDPSSPLTTEKELCELFGISRGTVRKALQKLVDDGTLIRRQHHGTFINPELRTSIPNRASIGIVAGDGEYAFLSSYVMGQLQGAFKVAIESNYYTRLLQFDGDAERCLANFKRSGGKGILWIELRKDGAQLLENARKQGLPIVTCLPLCNVDAVDCVDLDYYEYGRMVGKKLLGKGLRRILFIDNNAPEKLAAKRKGLEESFAEAGVEFDEDMFHRCDPVGSERRIEELLRERKPEAIHAPHVFKAIIGKALRGRADVFQLYPEFAGEGATSKLSLNEPIQEAGERAMTLLLRRIKEDASLAPGPTAIKMKMKYDEE